MPDNNTNQPAAPTPRPDYRMALRCVRACPRCFAIGELVDLGDDNEACESCAEELANV